jgi:hypothetical protein
VTVLCPRQRIERLSRSYSPSHCCGLLWSAAVTPGPSLFVVTRTSLTNGRRTAMTVALAFGGGRLGACGLPQHPRSEACGSDFRANGGGRSRSGGVSCL